MGIKKLFTFLDNNNLYKKYSYLNDLIQELDINKKKLLVGVDGNLFCYKYIHSYDNMLIGFFNQILKFISNKIIPIYIFDGGTLQEKENTNLHRYQKKISSKYKLEQLQEQINQNDNMDLNNSFQDDELLLIKKKLQKNSTKINNKNIITLLELLDLLNIPYLFSYGEGEYLAVMLNKYNIIDLFLTDDTDPIPAGINKTIKFYNNSVYYLETNIIYDNLNLDKKELCDLCILLGSDYAIFNHGLKPNELYELILKYKSIEEIIKNNQINCLCEESLIIINKIRNIYFNSDSFEKTLFLKNKNLLNNDYDNDNDNDNDINNDIDNDIDNSDSLYHTKKNNNNILPIKYSINLLIDHSNISFYSNIILEYWDEFIDTISVDLNSNNQDVIIQKSEKFKLEVCKFICKSKFNTKNIIKFIKNNIEDITDNEIDNMITSFDFLNNFGI
jgi:hypothetical protein